MPAGEQKDVGAAQIVSPLETGVSTFNLQEQLHDLQATTIVELYQVDARKYGAGIYKFHPGKVLNGDVLLSPVNVLYVFSNTTSLFLVAIP